MTYEFRWSGGGPGIEVPPSKSFESEDDLVDYINEVDSDLKKGKDGPYDVGNHAVEGHQRHDGIAFGDANVFVYEEDEASDGDAASVVGEMDAAVVLSDGEVDEDKL